MPRRAGAQASRWMLILDRLAASKAGATINELADEFSCTRRTIYRDLQQIEDWLRVPLVKEGEDEEHGSTRWRLMDGARFRPAIEFAPSELLSLIAASQVLAPLSGTPWGAGLATLQAKLRGRLSADMVRRMDEEAQELAATPRAGADYRKHAATVETLLKAVRSHETISMRYHSLSAGKTTQRKLDPYRLWYAEGALYVVGACHVHGLEPRTFAVDRIADASTTGAHFTIPKDFEWESYTRDSFRIFRGGEPAEVVVDFAAGIAPLVRERSFHRTQKVKSLPDGGARLTMHVAGLFEVTQWILGFGSQATVVAPPELVRLVSDEIGRMSERYRAGKKAPAPKKKARAR